MGGGESQTGSPKKMPIHQTKKTAFHLSFTLALYFPSLTHLFHDWTTPCTHPRLALHRVNPSHSADLIKRHFPWETLSHPKVRWGSPFNLICSFPLQHHILHLHIRVIIWSISSFPLDTMLRAPVIMTALLTAPTRTNYSNTKSIAADLMTNNTET